MIATIFVWPDASWKWAQDYDPVADSYKGDDFAQVNANPYASDEDIGLFAQLIANGHNIKWEI